MSRKKKIIVALSGGVDSAVAALLLKQQGYNVHGVFMQNWETDNDDPHCHAEQDLTDAYQVSQKLEIPFQVVNFSKQYWQNVFQHCLDEYAAGRTPNPDIWCNKEIKFKVLLEYALNQDADYLATGHYVRKLVDSHTIKLQKSKDINKDQTYFLYTVHQKALQHALFPIGDLEKPDVRDMAKEAGLMNHNKKDSTGICFIGERNFKSFLNEFLLAKPGLMKTPEGKTIGQHDGLMFYTLGQRKGLRIGGRQDTEADAWYVLDKDIENNTLIVGQGHDHPLLFSDQLIGEQLHWINETAPDMSLTYQAKTRYRQADQPCKITLLENQLFQVDFLEQQRAVTPGQSVVFYHNDICLGGGIIKSRKLI